MSSFKAVLLCSWLSGAVGFSRGISTDGTLCRSHTGVRLAGRQNSDDEQAKTGFPNPLQEIGDMFSSFDDVIDDFLFKRMGNGEVFYGKRKYKPSGRPNTEGRYNGMGISDKLKIDTTREYRDELMERRRQQKEEQTK